MSNTHNHTRTLVDELPNCDFCGEEGIVRPAAYDARMNSRSSWANMCPAHFRDHGVGLGLGKGQELILRSSVAGEASSPVKRITHDTYELTDDEVKASDRFDALLDQGMGIREAIETLRPQFPEITDTEFWAWLA